MAALRVHHVFQLLLHLLACSLFLTLADAVPAAPGYLTTNHDRIARNEEAIDVNHAARELGSAIVANSGICEKTPGVKQFSGYLPVGQNSNMFFWFFEARNSPETAPTVAWLQGGPGCSSLVGLFQEHGPCRFMNGSDEPSYNPYAWNEYANMLYIDQPVQTGFSYGKNDVRSTPGAAPYVWNLLQAFGKQFPQYRSRDFGLWTESYGGHFGPEFAAYILEKNKAIADGAVQGEHINLIALGINNGWIHPIDSFKSMIDYALSNNHRALITQENADKIMLDFEASCLPWLEKCELTHKDNDCKRADVICRRLVQDKVESFMSNISVYDVRVLAVPQDPPNTYLRYLNRTDVVRAIGAKQDYEECPNAPFDMFTSTGDDARSFLSRLSYVVASNVTTLIWAGDADWICNWYGNLDTAHAIEYPESEAFAAQDLIPYTMNGRAMGSYKKEGNLAFLRIYDAGHQVPYYQPEVSLQAFVQTMRDGGIWST